MSARTLDIGLDIDNVIYPWSTVFTRWVERRKGLDPGALDDVALSWTWYKDQWGMETPEMLDHFTSGVHAGVIFAQGDPTEGAVSCVRRLAALGHRIHYATNREIPGVSADHAWQVTHTWLHEHGFPVDSLTVSDDKNIGADCFLDDSPANIQALVQAGAKNPMLWHRPHNRNHVPAHTVPVIQTWHRFERAVRNIASR